MFLTHKEQELDVPSVTLGTGLQSDVESVVDSEDAPVTRFNDK